MKEYLFYIKNNSDAKKELSPEEHLAFIQKCELYITDLMNQELLIAAQPLVREGVLLSKSNGPWELTPLRVDQECQVGYYHIRATSIDQAIAIAKKNPEFDYVPSASIEIHEIKTKETETNFVYPKGI